MCRHLAYVGPPRALGNLLFAAPHSLCHQSEAPRHQREGAVNRDGWGVGWWGSAGVERYRTAVPMSEDTGFADADRAAAAFVAAARHASPHLALVESGNAPFTDGRFLFSLNGYVDGYADRGVGAQLRSQLPAARVDALEGDADSEVLFALVVDSIERGAEPGRALAATLATVRSRTDGRLNLLLADGERIWATTWGNSLFSLVDAGLALGGVVIASEPLDDHPGWRPIDDGSVVEASATSCVVHPLAGIEGVA